MEQEMPDYETIRAAVAGEKWALEKVLACYGDEINRLAMVKKRQPDGSVKEEMALSQILCKRRNAGKTEINILPAAAVNPLSPY